MSQKTGNPSVSPNPYLEEALALARVHGGSVRDVHALDDYTFARPSVVAVNDAEANEA